MRFSNEKRTRYPHVPMVSIDDRMRVPFFRNYDGPWPSYSGARRSSAAATSRHDVHPCHSLFPRYVWLPPEVSLVR